MPKPKQRCDLGQRPLQRSDLRKLVTGPLARNLKHRERACRASQEEILREIRVLNDSVEIIARQLAREVPRKK